ncbi:MAG: transcriptional regulator with XRE-family HTH domain [Paracoccaceae bacterium]|jgi:transcriptional regulator with XRE-family HTH domain
MVGMRIRERRRALGIKQGELAVRLGISPSYLNLIERNKRSATAHLVLAAAKELGLPPEALDGASERRLAEQLDEIAADPDYRDLDLPGAEGPELVGRHPQWARALARGWASARSARRTATALSDRLSHDPFLSDAVHRMLTNIAAIRSTSEILESVDDIDPPQRRRFHEILTSESGRLSQVAESLAQFFDTAHEPEGPSAPGEEAEDAFLAVHNRIDALDVAADAWRGANGVKPGVAGGPPLGLERALANAAREAGVEILTEDPDEPASRLARATADALILPLGASPAERRGALARAAAHAAMGRLAAKAAATLPGLTGDWRARRLRSRRAADALRRCDGGRDPPALGRGRDGGAFRGQLHAGRAPDHVADPAGRRRPPRRIRGGERGGGDAAAPVLGRNRTATLWRCLPAMVSLPRLVRTGAHPAPGRGIPRRTISGVRGKS